jgi:predicted enzyme related to lactoylglutathione lyase
MTKRSIVHIEIPAQNETAAGKFYQDLFGWKITHDEQMHYTMWEPGEGPGGGFNPLGPDTKPGNIILYVASADIEADLKKVEKLGGKVLRPKAEIPNTGWFALFQDPTGNTMALYTGMHPEGSH